MIPRDGDIGDRDLRQILRAAEIGVQWAHNLGPVASLRYLAARAPIDVRVSTPGGQPPHSVHVLRAVNRTDDSIESGCRVTWSWRRGEVRVSAIDVSDTGDEYDVTLGLLMG